MQIDIGSWAGHAITLVTAALAMAYSHGKLTNRLGNLELGTNAAKETAKESALNSERVQAHADRLHKLESKLDALEVSVGEIKGDIKLVLSTVTELSKRRGR